MVSFKLMYFDFSHQKTISSTTCFPILCVELTTEKLNLLWQKFLIAFVHLPAFYIYTTSLTYIYNITEK